ncbi:MAG: hypothetical protein ACJAR4_000402 [Psychroserpens sp.]|jgi:hypothetical protein
MISHTIVYVNLLLYYSNNTVLNDASILILNIAINTMRENTFAIAKYLLD